MDEVAALACSTNAAGCGDFANQVAHAAHVLHDFRHAVAGLLHLLTAGIDLLHAGAHLLHAGDHLIDHFAAFLRRLHSVTGRLNHPADDLVPSKHNRVLPEGVELWQNVMDSRQRCIEVSGLVAIEIDPPSGVQPVVWRLLSNRQTSTLEH